MRKRYVFASAGMIAIVLSATAMAQAGMQGTVTGVEDGGRKVMLKMSDGKMTTASVSASRTKIMVGGKEGTRESIKAGMNCMVMAPASGDATSLDCK